jgi:predicted O-methyltransferase YrrM
MRRGTYPGAAKMGAIFAHAPGDIRHRLWTFYWLARLLTSQPESRHAVVELGTRHGDSTRAFLAGLEDADNGSILFSYDIEDVGNRVREHTRNIGIPWPMATWAFSQKDSVVAGTEWQGGVDLVFIDTDHTLETTRRELDAWHKHVRPGGCFVLHDYWLHDPPRDKDEGRGVKIAADQFFGDHYNTWVLETHDATADGDTGLALIWRLAADAVQQ